VEHDSPLAALRLRDRRYRIEICSKNPNSVRSNKDLHAGDVVDKALNYIFAKAFNSGVERRRCFAPDEL
jgi:hypothetical protein